MNIKKAGLAALLALAVLTSMAVPAVAQSGAELADKEVTVNGDTESVYLEVTNTSGDNLNYTVYGISDGLSTEVDAGTISSVDENDTARQTFTVDSEKYDSYRVLVTEDASDSDTESADNIEIGTTVNQASGGGGVFAGVGGGGLFSPTNLLIGLVVIGGAYVAGFLDPLKNALEG
jgi:ABC-type oligopeptide transport system substrate-binding subunit